MNPELRLYEFRQSGEPRYEPALVVNPTTQAEN
jgi:hypothetical protein